MFLGFQAIFLSAMLVPWLTGTWLTDLPRNPAIVSIKSEIETTQSLDIDLLIPIYNDAGADEILENFDRFIQKDDTFVLVSGNNARQLDVQWLNNLAVELKVVYPENSILAATAGLYNIEQLVSGNPSSSISGVVYVYEPNMENAPEFDWDFTATLAIFDRAAEIVNAGGLQFVGKPTGQPLLATRLRRLSWDYGILGNHADALIIQTQTWCKQKKFDTALNRIIHQYRGSGSPNPWFAQITVDPGSPNGVPAEVAANCVRSGASVGVSNILVWWSPHHPTELEAFLRMIGRGGPTADVSP